MRAAVVAALAVLVAGCQPSRSDQVVLHLSNWGGASDDPVLAKEIDRLYHDFEKENPGIKLEIESVPDQYFQKMVLSFAADNPPDVISLDASSAAAFINNGVLADLAPFAQKDPSFKATDYWPNVYSIDSRGQSIYAIPGDFTPLVLYYNKKLFDRAGVPYPSGHWTFDQFLDTAKKLTTKNLDGTTKQYGFKFQNWMPGWIVWLWNNGGDVLLKNGSQAAGTLDSQKNIETIGFLRDLVLKDQVSPNLSQSQATGVDQFANGTAAMEISGHWELPGFKTAPGLKMEDVGVTEIPTNLPKPVTVEYEVGFAMPKKAKHPAESWKLIKYLTSRLYQESYQKTGIAVCGRQDVAQARAKDKREQQFLDIIPSAQGPLGARVVGYDFVEQEGVKMMERVLAGADPKQSLQQMAGRVDGYFKVR